MNTSFNIACVIQSSWSRSLEDLIFVDNSISLSRSEFLFKTSLAREVLKLHIGPKDKVLISGGRGIKFFIELFAVWSLGATAVPIAADATEDYIDFVSKTVSPKAYCGDLFLNGLVIDYDKEPEPQTDVSFEYYPVNADDDCAILFTSGSTGIPKGVLLSHQSILGNSRGILEILNFQNERVFVNTPFHFTSAICHFIACSLSGSCFIGIENKFLFSDLPKEISKYKITCFGGAPVQLRWIAEYLLAHEPQDIESLSSLKSVISSGDHLSEDIIEKFKATPFQVKIFTVYGLTELGGRFCVLRPEDINRFPGSVGKPIEGLSVEIHDSDTYEPLESGERGVIIASGKFVFKEYINNREATDKSLNQYGFNTGDIGYLNDMGYLYLVGRSDDVFKVNGQKLSSLLIQQEMMKLDLFDDVAVTPHVSELYGQIPKAYCVMKKDVVFQKGHILRMLRKELPLNHLPKEFCVVSKIPRTGSGKIQKHLLQNMV
ncbi:class I adenylate-forming enzyme family protein [Curvivirga aplysinae]|uniref:class I adenylate-forming enzyme family protein n=1 Tax=Curvivirga aplysinae TaxID=2529852 RepID=UPI0012BD4150|nr:class I adenylate-forming enzyme family protein [Curvivirga aplysinae]MTI10398.1 long-chain fatty acid--CoA ligase [Curvivirga aplysinae]